MNLDTPCKSVLSFLRKYISLASDGEPFRLLFPLGIILGIVGTALWPTYVWFHLPTYPGVIHSRIMIEGFLSSFVIGFLCTALPRLIDVPKITGIECLSFATLLLAQTALHLCGHSQWGDVLFCSTIVWLILSLAVRAIFRKDTPPPGFVLVIGGMLCALVGSFFTALSLLCPKAIPEIIAPLGKLLLYQGYLLLPIMGIGAFLLPRFFELPNQHSFPESIVVPQGWASKAIFAAICGGGILLSFVIEALQYPRIAYLLRASFIFIYFFREIPVHKAKFSTGTLALALRVALAAIPLGYLTLAIWPSQTVTYLHIIFITGFGLMTLVVASRVILGHSGQSAKFPLPLKSILFILILICLTMLTRVSADLLPSIRLSHLAYAGITWIIGSVIWILCIMPGVSIRDDE